MKGTIKSASELSAFFSSAKRINTRHFIALAAKATTKRDHIGRVAFIAGKKLGNAPLRSRAKRVMRAAYQQACLDNMQLKAHDIVFVAKKGGAQAKSQELAREMKRLDLRQPRRTTKDNPKAKVQLPTNRVTGY